MHGPACCSGHAGNDWMSSCLAEHPAGDLLRYGYPIEPGGIWHLLSVRYCHK